MKKTVQVKKRAQVKKRIPSEEENPMLEYSNVVCSLSEEEQSMKNCVEILSERDKGKR